MGSFQNIDWATERLLRFIEQLARDKKNPLTSVTDPTVRLKNINYLR